MSKHSSFGMIGILLLLGASYIFGKFQGGFVSWFLFYSYLPIALYSLFTYFFSLKGITVQRVMHKQKFTAGESLTVTYKIDNPYRFPLVYISIGDDLDQRLLQNAKGHGKIVYPWFKREFEIQYNIVQLPRGVFRWNKISLQTGDLFGFVKKETKHSHVQEIVVYPRYEDIRSWRTLNEKNMGMSYSLNQHAEDVASVMGIRDYAPGDRLSRIHWKASARTNALKTKEFEHQVTNDFMFFLDRERSSFQEGNEALFEEAVSLTATLARYALKRHFSCGLVSYGKEPNIITMSRAQEQLYRIFEHLARVHADATLPFIKTILREVLYVPSGTTVVIISPRLNQTFVRMLGELTYRKIKVEFFWIKGPRETTTEEKNGLSVLDQQQISYYMVSSSNFSDVLSGGDRHVSA